MSTLLDAIKEAIAASDRSRRRIASDTDIAESALCRLMSGERGLSIDAAERLARYLGIHVSVQPSTPKTRRKSKAKA